jgi:uncharacterized RmlC-like cupin family protein
MHKKWIKSLIVDLSVRLEHIMENKDLIMPKPYQRNVFDSQGICMHLLTIPPGKRAKAHLHQDHETAIYMLQGKSAMWYGEKLEQHMDLEVGDFLYIPAGMPHLPYNPSESESCTALIARTDPNEQESVLLLPELDAVWQKKRSSAD